MLRIPSALVALALVSPIGAAQIDTFPYLQDFESGPGGFVTFASGDWEWGVPGGEFVSTAASGTSAWVTDLDGPYSSQATTALESPPIDCTGFVTDPFLQFARIHRLDSGTVARVEISIDDGPFTTLGAPNDPGSFNWYTNSSGWIGDSGPDGTWLTTRHALDGAAGHVARVRWVVDAGNAVDEGLGVDDVAIFGDFIDVGVTALLNPTSGLALDGTEPVGVTLTNFGTQLAFGFPVSYEVTGPVTSSWAQNQFIPLPPIAPFVFNFGKSADLSVPGLYEVRVWVDVPGDQNPANDELVVHVLHQGTVDVFPYVEDFEGDDGGYVTGGTNSSWEHGAPSGTNFDDAASGFEAWVTDLDGAYSPGEQSYLQSPEFDLTAFAADPFLSFAHSYWFEGNDEGWLEVSYDGGPFQKLGGFGSPASLNWYDDPNNNWWDGASQPFGEWRTARHLITGGAGRRVVIRWIVNATNAQPSDEGMAVDDVRIESAPFGAGQSPRPEAALDVNDASEVIGFPVTTSGPPGPYFTAVAIGSQTFDLRVDGTPNQPIVLLGGSLAVGTAQLGNIGQLDLSPATVFASGLDPSGLGAFFVTTSNGSFELGVSVPLALVGSVLGFQAAVADADGAFHLSNAVQVAFLP